MFRPATIATCFLLFSCPREIASENRDQFQGCECGGSILRPGSDFGGPFECIDAELRRVGIDPKESCGKHGTRIRDFADAGPNEIPFRLPEL